HWRAFVLHHRFDFTAQHPLIEFERRFALAIERQIRIELHRPLLWIMEKVLSAISSLRALARACARLRSPRSVRNRRARTAGEAPVRLPLLRRGERGNAWPIRSLLPST